MVSTLTDSYGYPPDALRPLGPYDAIHVGAAARSLPPALVDQLASPGRMFVPVGTTSQTVFQIDKDEKGNIVTTEILDVRVCML
jgi:protein-L-isoaspartate(D-aspartate) O-methyltransferase